MFSLPTKSKLLSSDFIWGVGTSSYQIEGAVNSDEREPSIWDTFCKTAGNIKNYETGDVACDHFHRWEQDLKLVRDLGFGSYRFSIAWPRVMRSNGELNPKGFDFYKRIIAQLNEWNIKPFVTLYHWDLPQSLQEKGGWLNRDTAFLFRDYIDAVSRELQDGVFAFTTLNEPFCSSILSYEMGIHAPGIQQDCGLTPKQAGKQAAHHLLLAHGLGMQVLQTNSPDTENGIVVNVGQHDPASKSEPDHHAAILSAAENNYWFLDPLFKGCYPSEVEEVMAHVMPKQIENDMDIISQPVDYLGINYYTRHLVKADNKNHYQFVENSEAKHTAMGWEVCADGLQCVLNKINRRYESLPEIYITENGAAFDDEVKHGKVIDNDRIEYFDQHLNAVNSAINDGVDIKGYFAWSLLDNFEWAEGYSKRFGIVYVDYDSQTRILKDSALVFEKLLKKQ